MKNVPPPTPILTHNENGGDQVSRRSLHQRAQEIAEIEGRAEATVEDRTRARRELNGDDLPGGNEEDAASANSLSRDPSDPVAQHGRQTPTHEDPEEQTNLEKLVTEGVEEAQHDQMLADRHRHTD